ncbi:MAG TPA: GH1 family beta-glucosidase, partial [Polyangiaceae bacterium]|nr:GH1 family beta-glucosidase [Polyangiaceae bacterium]
MTSSLSRRAVLKSLGPLAGSALAAGCAPALSTSPCTPESGPAANPPPPSNSPAAAANTNPAQASSPFPKDFQWGAATAAYQIEGAANEDGRGTSIWDVFSKKPGNTFENQTGDIACDHYHRFPEDVALLKNLGARAYRLSVAWPRIFPQGRGAVNEKGLDFYKRLLDELARAGIAPMVTLFHWDFPQALFEKGGWLSRDSAEWFGEYTHAVVSRLGDRISTYITLNEPSVYIGLGHMAGKHAPGLHLSRAEGLLAAHNTMRAHGRSVQAIRAASKAPVQIGHAVAFWGAHPLTNSPGDLEAARLATFSFLDDPFISNSWWMDPTLTGRYPEQATGFLRADMPKGYEQDLALIHQPVDFMGLNLYGSNQMRQRAGGGVEYVPYPAGFPRAANDWQPLVPQALYFGPRFAYERYRLPIHITENGLSVRDQLFLDGTIQDAQRIDYLQRALSEMARALRENIPIRGYFHWSLLDNFEWADAYKQRF